MVQLHGIGVAFCAQVRGQIFGAEQRGADARAPAGNGTHVDYAQRSLAHRQDPRRARHETEGNFPIRDGRVQRAHLVSAGGLRISDQVGSRRHGGGQVDRPVVVERIDAHRGDPARITPALDQLRKSAARFVAARRWREIFQIDDQRVGAAALHGIVRDGVGTRSEQPRAYQVEIGHRHGSVVNSQGIQASSAIRLRAKVAARVVTPVDDSNAPTPRTLPLSEMRAMIRGRDTPHTVREPNPRRYSRADSTRRARPRA